MTMQIVNLLYEFTNTLNPFLTFIFGHGIIKPVDLALEGVEC